MGGTAKRRPGQYERTPEIRAAQAERMSAMVGHGHGALGGPQAQAATGRRMRPAQGRMGGRVHRPPMPRQRPHAGQ